MKKLLKFTLICLLFITSCNKDDDNQDSEVITEVPTLEIIATEPCFISDFTIEENSTITIDCLLDLEGQTVNVPSGVTFTFDGGTISNGTLNFSSTGKIDGELLNSALTLEGDVSLTSETFNFYPERWDIVETDANLTLPTQEEAYNNHLILQSTIDLVKEMGANTFTINKLNAFFDSLNNGENWSGIPVAFLPSDFHLSMTDNTYLRVFPISSIASSIMLEIYRESNVKVTGGNLVGDRIDHGPIVGTGVLFKIKGGKNVAVDAMHISYSTSAGIAIEGDFFIGDDNYFGSKNVVVSNTTFDSNRYNNLQVTDGQNITLEYNKSYNAGIELDGKYGVSEALSPAIGILLETQPMQYVDNVIIRGNDVKNSEGLSILAVGSSNIEIIDNTAERSIGWSTAQYVKITNNTAKQITGGRIGYNGIDNIVSGNTITNEEGSGLYLTDENVKVFDNDFVNCKTAMQLISLKNTEIYNNTITSDITSSVGILGQNYLNNVLLRDNDFNLSQGKALNILYINRENENIEDNYFTFKDNIITASENGVINGSYHINIIGNQFTDAGFVMNDVRNAVVDSNTIHSKTSVAFSINKGADDNAINIKVSNNWLENKSTNSGTSIGVLLNVRSNSTPLDGDSNITFYNNDIIASGNNFGFHSTGFNGLVINDNRVVNESIYSHPLFFSGNNSTITNNIITNKETTSEFQEAEIEGNNNTVSNN